MIVSGVNGRSLRTMLPIQDRRATWCDIAVCSPRGRLIAVILVYRVAITDDSTHALTTAHICVWVVYEPRPDPAPLYILVEP